MSICDAPCGRLPNPPKMPMNLQASWIWTPEDLPRQNQFVFFRKSFTLTGKPDEASCVLTAERFYQVWINGVSLGQGPASGHPSEKACDLYDVSQWLHPGRNVVAVVVQFDGDVDAGDGHGRWYVPPTRGGLWCQVMGRIGEASFRTASDETWTTRRAIGWRADVHYMNDLYFQEVYRAGADPPDWNTADFDDGAWSQAVRLGEADGMGADGGPLPWGKLVPRDFPLLTRTCYLPVHVEPGEVVERMGGGDNPNATGRPYPNIALQLTLEPVERLSKAIVEEEAALLHPGGDAACMLCNSDPFESVELFDGVHDATLTLDFGQLRNAHLVLEVEGPIGACLDIGYGPNLLDGRVSPYRSSRTAWADRLILSDGPQRWRSFFWRQFRFVQITLRNARGPVRLRRVEAEAVTHTWDRTTRFSCSDPELETFWRVAERTAEVCTMDVFSDTFAREGCQYSNDVSQMLPASVALHGDAPFYRRYLRQFALSQLPNGVFMDACPGKGSFSQISPDAGFLHVKAVWEHYARFGQRDLIEEHWEPIRRHLAFWGALVNARGLLTVEDTHKALDTGFWWPWMDWAPIDRQGEHLPLNARYLSNLRAAAGMGRLLGDDESAMACEEHADRIAGVLKKEFWDERRGLFVDALVNGRQGSIVSEHSQGLMLQLGLATRQQAERLTAVWRQSPQDLVEANIPFIFHVLEGLMDYGYAEMAMNLLRRLRRHLRLGQETFGEVWTMKAAQSEDGWRTMDSRAVAHGAASWPVTFLLEHVVGLQPRWGTLKALRLAPIPVVDRAQVTWCGIEVQWEQSGREWHLVARFAQPTPVEFVLPFPPAAVQSLWVDGQEKPVQALLRMEPRKALDVRVERVAIGD